MRIANVQPAAQPLAQTIEGTVPLSINDLSERILLRSEAERLTLQLAYITDYMAWFRLTKTVSLLFTVEMTGKLEERGDAMTLVTAEVRISPITYAVVVILALLTLLTLSSPVALLFGLLCLRVVLMLIFCAPDTRAELVGVLDNL